MSGIRLGKYFQQAAIGRGNDEFRLPTNGLRSGDNRLRGSTFLKVVESAKLFKRDDVGVFDEIRRELGIAKGKDAPKGDKPLLNRTITAVKNIIVKHFDENDQSLSFLMGCVKSDENGDVHFSAKDVELLEAALTKDEKLELRRTLVRNDFDFESSGDAYEFIKYKLRMLTLRDDCRSIFGGEKGDVFRRFAQDVLALKGLLPASDTDVEILKNAVARLSEKKLAESPVIDYRDEGAESADMHEFMEACFKELTDQKAAVQDRMTALQKSCDDRVGYLLKTYGGKNNKDLINAIAFGLTDVNASLDRFHDRLRGAVVDLSGEKLTAEFDTVERDFKQILDSLLPIKFSKEANAKPLTAEGAKVRAGVHLDKFVQDLVASAVKPGTFPNGDVESVKKFLGQYGRELFADELKWSGELIAPSKIGRTLPGVMQKMRACLDEVVKAYLNEPDYAKKLDLDGMNVLSLDGKNKLLEHCRADYLKTRSELLKNPEFYKNPWRVAEDAFARDVLPSARECRNFANEAINDFADKSGEICADMPSYLKQICAKREVKMDDEVLATWAEDVAEARAQKADELLAFAIDKYLGANGAKEGIEDARKLVQGKRDELLKDVQLRKERFENEQDFLCGLVFKQHRKEFGGELEPKAMMKRQLNSKELAKLANFLDEKSSLVWEALQFSKVEHKALNKIVNERFDAYEAKCTKNRKEGEQGVDANEFKKFVDGLKTEMDTRLEKRVVVFREVLDVLFRDIESRGFPKGSVPMLIDAGAEHVDENCEKLQNTLLEKLKLAKLDILVCEDDKLANQKAELIGALKEIVNEGVREFNGRWVEQGRRSGMERLADFRLLEIAFVDVDGLKASPELQEGLETALAQWKADGSRCRAASELQELVDRAFGMIGDSVKDMVGRCVEWLKTNVDRELLMDERSAKDLKSGNADKGRKIAISTAHVMGKGDNKADLINEIVKKTTQAVFRDPLGFDAEQMFEDTCKPMIKAAAMEKGETLNLKYLESLQKKFLGEHPVAGAVFARKSYVLEAIERKFGTTAADWTNNNAMITKALAAIALNRLDELTSPDEITAGHFVPEGGNLAPKEVSVDRRVINYERVEAQKNIALEACDNFTEDLLTLIEKVRERFMQAVHNVDPTLAAARGWGPAKEAFAKLDTLLAENAQTLIDLRPDCFDASTGKINFEKIDFSRFDAVFELPGFKNVVADAGKTVEAKRSELLKNFGRIVDEVFDKNFRKCEFAKDYRNALGAGGIDDLRRQLGTRLADLERQIESREVALNEVESKIANVCKGLVDQVDRAVQTFNAFAKDVKSAPGLEAPILQCRIRPMLSVAIANTGKDKVLDAESLKKKIGDFLFFKGYAPKLVEDGPLGADLMALGREILLEDGKTIAESAGSALPSGTIPKDRDVFFRLLMNPSEALNRLLGGGKNNLPEDIDRLRFEVAPRKKGLSVRITPSASARHGREFSLLVNIEGGKISFDTKRSPWMQNGNVVKLT